MAMPNYLDMSASMEFAGVGSLGEYFSFDMASERIVAVETAIARCNPENCHEYYCARGIIIELSRVIWDAQSIHSALSSAEERSKIMQDKAVNVLKAINSIASAVHVVASSDSGIARWTSADCTLDRLRGKVVDLCSYRDRIATALDRV